MASQGVTIGAEIPLDFGTGVVDSFAVEDILDCSTEHRVRIFYRVVGRKRHVNHALG